MNSLLFSLLDSVKNEIAATSAPTVIQKEIYPD